ncbi:hypothetical protein [Cohnella sp. GbtcB17]|uniref:hypothetical protein n=1 Tax=Cohnella sp. GbtcB17 TaxID=2824762 RepID=UPI001C304E2D|nr:hypothetical protein [Cohnella sp. GbtcB17]
MANKKLSKWATGALTATLAAAIAVPSASANVALPGAKFEPVRLHAAATKNVVYYKTGDASIPSDLAWTTATDIPFLPGAVTGDVTAAFKDKNNVYWIGTETGLQRVDFTESDARDIVQYFAGPRYLYGGDDHVLALASDGDGGVWAKTASGVTHITMPKMTLLERTSVYEKLVKAVNDRRGMASGASFTFSDGANSSVDYSSATGKFTGSPATSDNDGLWTTMYAIGEIFRYRTLKDEAGASPTAQQQADIEAAKADALRASKAVLLLDYVSGRGNGFPARSYMLTGEGLAQTTDGTDYGFQSQNGLWFHTIVGDNVVNPNPIIPSMQQAGKTPIGYGLVRVTKDAESKKGDTLFPSGGSDVMNYNGFGLSQEAIDALNETRPDGQKLGIDIKTSVAKNVYQVLPVITAKTNNANAAEDKTTTASNKPLFQLTVPVYEKIPKFFNDLFPASAIGSDGYIDQNQIVYKADTSSDEVDGHYALFFTAYQYLCDDASDPELAEFKRLTAEATDRMTNLILKDDHYYIEDATGKSTQWSRWLSKYFNDSLSVMEKQALWTQHIGVDENGDDALSYGYEDGPLNALEIMSMLKTAITVTAEAYPQDQAKFKAAYDLVYDGDYSKEEPFVNGKGYINMALDYQARRLVRQANNAYGINDNNPATYEKPGYTGDREDDSNINATLHGDWTQYINYSDEELGWFPVYELILQEEDPVRKAQIVAAYDQWYANEKREENPFYTFLYQMAHPEDTSVDLASAVRFLYRMPLYRIELPAQYDRQDVLYIEPGDRDKFKQTNYALAPDERKIIKNNNNPFAQLDAPYTANPNFDYYHGNMDTSAVFTLPYWMGRYFGIIKEAQ